MIEALPYFTVFVSLWVILFLSVSIGFGLCIVCRFAESFRMILIPFYSVVGFSIITCVAWLGLLLGAPLGGIVFGVLATALVVVSIRLVPIIRNNWIRIWNLSLLKESPRKLRNLLGRRTLREGIVIVTAVLFSVSFFSAIVTSLHSWAPPGDANVHGTLVSLILANNGKPTTYSPISNATFDYWRYPLGFHSTTALFSSLDLLIGIYPIVPGQSMVVLASYVSLSIALLVLSTVLWATRNMVFGLAAFLLTFLTPGLTTFASPYHDLLFSNLLNGTFPDQMALFFVIGAASGVFILSSIGENLSLNKLMPIIVVTFAAFVTYYIYILYTVELVLVALFFVTHRRKLIMLSLAGFFVVSIFAGQLYQLLPVNGVTATIADFVLRSPTYSMRSGDLTIEYSVVITLAIIDMTIVCAMSLARLPLLLPVLILSVPIGMVLSFPSLVYVLWVFPTRRIWPALFCISVITLFLATAKINLAGRLHITRNAIGSAILLVGIMVVLVFSAGFQPSNWQKPSPDDMGAMSWIQDHTSPLDLVANDITFPGLFLTSVRAQNVTSDLQIVSQFSSGVPIDNSFALRSVASTVIFLHPENYSAAKSFFESYNVRYVYLSSYQVYLDYWHPTVTGGLANIVYKTKSSLSQAQYLQFFTEDPCMEAVYLSQTTGVFQVLPSCRA